ncbi:cell division protein FtsK [Pasteurellaceae bacterium Macca]|nr:cell division protein FtsK [Pasteurellaceae bacterium Macca]
MIQRLKERQKVTQFALGLLALLGIGLIIAWASYSPLDSGWSVASSATEEPLNRLGYIGAWWADLLFAMWGKVAFVLPFGMTFTAIYLLIARQATFSVKKILGWMGSFILLLIGLAGLANSLLANSPYYLSGGFVGAGLEMWLGSSIWVSLVGLLLTAVGFYFCSGQILLQLFNQGYTWIMEGSTNVSSIEQEEETTTAEMPEATAEEMATDSAPTPKKSGFTDVSAFSRPNITGLKRPDVSLETTQPTPEVALPLTDISGFKVENSTPLPKVTVADEVASPRVSPPSPTNSPKIQHYRSAVDIEPETEQENEVDFAIDMPAMPTVRLNNAPQERVASPKMVSEKLAETAEVATEDEVKDEEWDQLPQEEYAVKEVTLPPVSHNEPKFLQSEPKIALEPIEPEPRAEKETSLKQPTSSVSYPKGYGDSLIHPLLQRKKTLEKPATPLPTLDLLEAHPASSQQITEQEIVNTSMRIEQELANFNVKATVEDVLVGPVVTRYEIKPAAGVKASKITGLENDLARAMVFQAIRITEVVPGKPYMGIETPNSYRETVWLRDVLDSPEFRHSKAILPMALGKDISGNPVVVDMAKMPHLLVAGQTGGGKSVGVNTMILSLLYKLTPAELRFIMIDPKVVELSIYNDIPHLLTPVVTDMKKAENALRWAVEEMERRYLLVSSLQVRNIEGYNAKIDQAMEMNLPIPNPLWRPGDTMDALPPPLEKMSYIVLIVDEFADLMMSAGKQVEDHIMRIAQKARAVGIHLILATQRPSTDVITGVIKANIPSRIAFTVASQIDSRTILDKGGAESLLGRGDMLYSGAGNAEIIRVHGAFMSDDDVQNVADNWRARGKPDYIESIVTSHEEEGGSGERDSSDLDPLFDEITQFMLDGGATSISGIQRRFSIGFNRAARIIDQLEEQGILSSPDNRGKRELLSR